MTKKVLIITYYWPPSGGSGVQRWLKFSKYLPKFGCTPVIYTPENPEPNAVDNDLLKEIPKGTTVVKRKILEPYRLYKLFSGKGKNDKIEANILSDSSKKDMKSRLFAYIRGNFFIPDPRCMWIRPSVRYLKKYIKENEIDTIISTGPPHSMHLIANKVKKQTGVRWIADFRDPWTGIFYFKHLPLSSFARRRHKFLELEVLKNADIVVTATNDMAASFIKIGGEKCTGLEQRIKVIHNGFDLQDFKSAQPVASLPDYDGIKEKFLLIHTGIMVDNGNPDTLWRVLGKMCKEESQFKKDLQIRCMGQIDSSIIADIKAHGLEGNFVNMGYVPHSSIPTWQRAADLLLLPLRKEPEAVGILTGKFFEYLAAGGEILAFGPKNGDLDKAMRETESGTLCEWDDNEGIESVIRRSYANFLNRDERSKRLSEREKMEMSKSRLKYSRESEAGEIASIVYAIQEQK